MLQKFHEQCLFHRKIPWNKLQKFLNQTFQKKTSWRSEKWYVRVVGKKNKIVIMDLWKHQWCTLISFSQFIYLPDYSFQDAHQWFSENQSYIFFGSNEFSSRIDCKIKGTEGWKRKEAAEKKRNQGKEERRLGQL